MCEVLLSPVRPRRASGNERERLRSGLGAPDVGAPARHPPVTQWRTGPGLRELLANERCTRRAVAEARCARIL
jgi:hypothetical protein